MTGLCLAIGAVLLGLDRQVGDNAFTGQVLVGLGILSTVGLQALINLLVVTGLAPTKGIALPLLSSGGTGWILTAASLGILVAMDRVRAPQTHQMALPVPHAEPKPLAIPLPFPAPPLIAEPQAA